jgi:monovalent cation/hydrogen antiporter
LVRAGVALALIPGTPRVVLDPQLALALFVAPVLLDAAYDASPRDLKRNLVPVSSLAIAAVVATILAVAAVIRHIVPGMGWPTALTLGAIVAPPDASAAVTGVVAGWSVVPLFFLTCGGGVIAGVLLARLFMWAVRDVRDIPIAVLLQFIGTFAVWLLANRIGVSATMTMIAYAMTLARRAPMRIDARRREYEARIRLGEAKPPEEGSVGISPSGPPWPKHFAGPWLSSARPWASYGHGPSSVTTPSTRPRRSSTSSS